MKKLPREKLEDLVGGLLKIIDTQTDAVRMLLYVAPIADGERDRFQKRMDEVENESKKLRKDLEL